jgi:hypothetical protein
MTFRSDMLPTSSGSKSKPSNQELVPTPALIWAKFLTRVSYCFLLAWLTRRPCEDVGHTFYRCVNNFIPDFMAPHPRRQYSSTQNLKSTIFGDITPCNSVEVRLRFGGTYCLHLQDYCRLLLAGFLIFGHENRWGSKRRWVNNIKMDLRDIGWCGMDWIDEAYISMKRQWTFSELHGGTS